MPKKSRTAISASTSQGMRELLLDPEITVAMHNAKDALEKIMFQIGLDTSDKDDEEILRIVKGGRQYRTVFLMFAAEGKHDLPKD